MLRKPQFCAGGPGVASRNQSKAPPIHPAVAAADYLFGNNPAGGGGGADYADVGDEAGEVGADYSDVGIALNGEDYSMAGSDYKAKQPAAQEDDNEIIDDDGEDYSNSNNGADYAEASKGGGKGKAQGRGGKMKGKKGKKV